MIHHHPAAELLIDLASGRLSWGMALIVRTHLDGCADCREQVRMLEAVGGNLLNDATPAPLDPQALVRTLTAIDALHPAHRPASRSTAASAHARRPLGSPLPSLPDGMQWPRSLRHCRIGLWRWLGPGMRMSRIRPPAGVTANTFLLRIGAGRPLAMHSHRGIELTQILYGHFNDGRATFGPGDFDATDAQIHHQPVVDSEGECLCVAAVDGRIVFDGAIARTFGRMIGL